MRRRELVGFVCQAMVLPGVLTACQSVPQARHNPMTGRTQIGLQLSTLNALMSEDFDATLAAVAEVGYKQVEFSAMGLMGRDPQQVKTLLSDYGLTAPVGRVSPKLPSGFFEQAQEDMRAAFMRHSAPERFLDNVKYSLEIASAFEQKILNLPAMMPATFADIKGVLRNIDLLNQAGDICSANGVLFGYHNHNWEFARVKDTAGRNVIPYELMLENTDPGKVTFQLDSYWVAKAGVDLFETLERYPGRFSSCHLKDIDAAGAMADVGEGEINFPKFINAAKQSGARYFFVERDNPPQPMRTARISYGNLSKMAL